MTNLANITPELVKKAGVLLKQEHTRRLELEKQATADALEKRAQRIAFREVELGITLPFQTFEDFQQKVASLAQENLDVVEKALERGYSRSASESLEGGASGKKLNPMEHYVLHGELEPTV